jgi:NAD(P)H-hydrate epimerase
MTASNHVLLSVEEMGQADAWTDRHSTPSASLMERAGTGIAAAADRLRGGRPVAVLCGPGNNGGDGYVAARRLREAGVPVRVGALGDPAKLSGDAAGAYQRWPGAVDSLDDLARWAREVGALVIDALFGAGLSKPIEGDLADHLDRLSGLPVVAVDMPSGVHGDTGEVWGTSLQASETVTFFRAKPGHYLYPGRARCGDLRVIDIGIPDACLKTIGPRSWVNDPALWRDRLPQAHWSDHKYKRGHALFLAGPMTGAARLAAQAARRAGAGLMTVAGPDERYDALAGDAPGVIVADDAEFDALLADERRNAVGLGPGLGVGAQTSERVRAVLATGRATVLDADALTSFADDREGFFHALHEQCVLTPHDGEYARLFGGKGDRLSRARAAAAESGATIVLKGADTVIAHPDGRAAINHNAPASLATGGTGDVLTGLILGLMAQHMPAFEAACAAVWMQGDSAAAFGPGLIAEDVIAGLPAVWRRLVD